MQQAVHLSPLWEAVNEATILKTALEKEGVTAFLSRVPERPASLANESEVARAIDTCELVVIMGTLTYGKDTGAGFSTHEELTFACEEKKPLFLVKMCERFEEEQTRALLSKAAIRVSQWRKLPARR